MSASFTSSRMKDSCQKWKVKLIVRGAYRLSGTEIVERLEIIDVGCNPKQFDGLTWLTLTPVFYDRSTPLLDTLLLCNHCWVWLTIQWFYIVAWIRWGTDPPYSSNLWGLGTRGNVELFPKMGLLPYLTGKACYRLALRPQVGRMHLASFQQTFKSELQCSCLNSLGTKKCFPNCFLRFPTRALHLPRGLSARR